MLPEEIKEEGVAGRQRWEQLWLDPDVPWERRWGRGAALLCRECSQRNAKEAMTQHRSHRDPTSSLGDSGLGGELVVIFISYQTA